MLDLYKMNGINGLIIVILAHADIAYGQAKLPRDRNYNAALCSAVELREHHSGRCGRVGESRDTRK